MKKTQIFMNKLVYLDLSISQINKIVMCEFCCDYIKLKYNVRVKTEDIYEDIGEDVE